MRSLEGSALKLSTNGKGGRSPGCEHVREKHPQKTRILIADEHPLFRHGFMDFINDQSDMVVCGEAATAPATSTGIRLSCARNGR